MAEFKKLIEKIAKILSILFFNVESTFPTLIKYLTHMYQPCPPPMVYEEKTRLSLRGNAIRAV